MASANVSTKNPELQVGNYSVSLDKVLGKGSYGVVHPATDSKGSKVAAKRIDGKDKRKMEKITKDLNKLMTLDHPNIVKIFDIHQVHTTIWMFMEFCEYGDLNDFFYKQKITECQKLQLMRQISQGVEYLHANNIIHRDIKPANILISNHKPIVVKLTDFDFSKFLEPNYDTSLMTTNVGTAAFKAPEFYQGNKQGVINYHRNVDIFAMGVRFLSLIQKNENLVPQIETPNDDSELYVPIGQLLAERNKYGTKPLDVVPSQDEVLLSEDLKSMKLDGEAASEKFPVKIRKLVQKMTCVVPEERISAEEVVHFFSILTPVCLTTNVTRGYYITVI